jgi:IS30 family transposase
MLYYTRKVSHEKIYSYIMSRQTAACPLPLAVRKIKTRGVSRKKKKERKKASGEMSSRDGLMQFSFSLEGKKKGGKGHGEGRP